MRFMKNILLAICLLVVGKAFALEYEVLLENDLVTVCRVKIMPQEEIGLHYDQYPQVVVARQGGVITRLEQDGSTTDVEFPTDVPVYRPAETADKIHKSVNNQPGPIELIITQIKK